MKPYFYRFKPIRVIDGDTIEGDLDLGFRLTQRVHVRLAGYDAPETYRPKDDEEKQKGLLCKQYLEKIIGSAKEFFCGSKSIDLYNRPTGLIYYKAPNGDMIEVNRLMITFIQTNGLNK
jgi:micrococcal nuclease